MSKVRFSRRRFLKTGLAGMVGSTIGRRSSADVSTQFSKRAVSRTSLKSLRAIPTTCRQCPAGCGILAYLWLLHNPAVTCPIVGVNTVEQLEDNLKAVEIELSAEVLKELDEIFPSPRPFNFMKYRKGGFSNIGNIPGVKQK